MEKEIDESKPFSLVQETLQSIRKSLNQLTQIQLDPNYSLASKQVAKIEIVKSVYKDCTGLIGSESHAKFQEILHLEPSIEIVQDPRTRKDVDKRPYFDRKLDIKMDVFLINLQRELQLKGYFDNHDSTNE